MNILLSQLCRAGRGSKELTLPSFLSLFTVTEWLLPNVHFLPILVKRSHTEYQCIQVNIIPCLQPRAAIWYKSSQYKTWKLQLSWLWLCCSLILPYSACLKCGGEGWRWSSHLVTIRWQEWGWKLAVKDDKGDTPRKAGTLGFLWLLAGGTLTENVCQMPRVLWD